MTREDLDTWLRAYGAAWDLDGVFVLDFGDDGLCTRLQERWDGRETTSTS